MIAGIRLAAGYSSAVTDRFVDDETPGASFEFSYDRASERLTVEHAGGEPVPDRQLVVRSGNRTVGNFSAYETVTAGDAIVVQGVTLPEGVGRLATGTAADRAGHLASLSGLGNGGSELPIGPRRSR